MIGPLPYPDLPEQPRFFAWCTEWTAYDVPRLWDIVRLEDDQLGWEQIKGFSQLSDLLTDQYRRLRAQWTSLSDAWQGPAADAVLSRLDTFSVALLSDAHCAATTATALHGIMSTYADARAKVGRLSDHWNNVTSDWIPEWWDQAAAELNTEGAHIMREADQAVRDHRFGIIIPSQSEGQIFHPLMTSDSDDPTGRSSGTVVPATPGHMPAAMPGGEHQSEGGVGGGLELADMPSQTPASPGQPVSMLPIPPGSPYAPNGGAYILPGPGVGRGGYIVPTPGRGSFGGGGSPALRGTNFNNGSNGTNMMPVPMSGATAPRQNSGVLYRRSANYVWHVEKGVPPIIEPIDDDTVIPNQPSPQQEEAFKEWFAELAYPWRAGAANEPQVILRRVAP
jgi:uncharacterized protein YukE